MLCVTCTRACLCRGRHVGACTVSTPSCKQRATWTGWLEYSLPGACVRTCVRARGRTTRSACVLSCVLTCVRALWVLLGPCVCVCVGYIEGAVRRRLGARRITVDCRPRVRAAIQSIHLIVHGGHVACVVGLGRIEWWLLLSVSLTSGLANQCTSSDTCVTCPARQRVNHWRV